MEKARASAVALTCSTHRVVYRRGCTVKVLGANDKDPQDHAHVLARSDRTNANDVTVPDELASFANSYGAEKDLATCPPKYLKRGQHADLVEFQEGYYKVKYVAPIRFRVRTVAAWNHNATSPVRMCV